jgi:hypothetical protein
MPTLTRVGGFGVGNTQKGQIRVGNLGEGLAYVNLSSPPPFIYLELKFTSGYGNYVFINLNDANDTRKLYESIQTWLQS